MTTTRRRLLFFAAGLGAVVACSSTGGGTQPVAGTPLLSGTYKATTPGNIVEITFYEGAHYVLIDATCASTGTTSCAELGTYALDGAAGTLTLTPEGGVPDVLPFKVLVSSDDAPSAASAPLHTLGGGAPLTGSDASLTSGSDASLTAGDGGALGGDAATLVPCPATTLTHAGVPLVQGMSAGGQNLSGGSSPSTPPQPGAQWPGCTGSFQTSISPNGAYYLTSFGCSSSPSFGDSGDNCCAQGVSAAASAGICPGAKNVSCSNSCENNSSCNSWRSSQTGAIAAAIACEEKVNWYATGGATFGLGTRLCLSAPAGSGGSASGVVVMVFDNGPACSIETRASAFVLDVSPPTVNALFGELETSVSEQKAVYVTRVSSSTPLGPGSCASAATGSDAGSSQGGDGGAGNGASSDAGGAGPDGGCSATSSCKVDGDCNPSGPLGLVCVNDVCVSGCHTSAQCASGMTCSGGACTGGGGASCTNDGACNPGGNGAGMICSGGQCVAGCHASYQCPGNTSCHGGQCT